MRVNKVMPRVLTKLQIEQYHDQGFICPIRVISEQEALSIKDELEQVEKILKTDNYTGIIKNVKITLKLKMIVKQEIIVIWE